MKTFLFFLFCITANAQNFGVVLWSTVGTNDQNWQFTPPTNAPYVVRQITGTNVNAPEVFMSSNTLFVCQQTNSAAMSAFQVRVAASQAATNAAVSLINSSNYAAWIGIYTNIALGVADTSNRMANVTSLTASWKSGTNSAAGTNNIITSMFSHWYYDWVYFNQVLQYLKVLGPGVQPPPQQ